MSPTRWGSRARPRTSGGDGGGAKATSGCVDRSSRPHSCPTRTPRTVERRVEVLRRNASSVRHASPGSSAMPASTVYRILCRQGLNRLAWMDRPSGTVIRRRASNTPVPASSSRWTSRNWGASPRVAAGGPGDAATSPSPAPSRSATRSCTPRSTVTAASRTAKSSATRKPSPRSGSGNARTPGSASSGSRSSASRPTTVLATRPSRSPRRSKPPERATDDSHPGGRNGTAKSNASTAPSSTNGPTCASTAPKRLAPPRLHRWLHLYNHPTQHHRARLDRARRTCAALERRARVRRGCAAAASGLVLALAFPPFDVGVVALVALVPLCWAWRDASSRTRRCTAACSASCTSRSCSTGPATSG